MQCTYYRKTYGKNLTTLTSGAFCPSALFGRAVVQTCQKCCVQGSRVTPTMSSTKTRDSLFVGMSVSLWLHGGSTRAMSVCSSTRGCGRTSDNRASAILASVSYPNWENTFLHPEAFWAFLVMICCSDSDHPSVCIQQQSEHLDNCRQMPRRLMLQWWKRMFFLGLMWERRMERSCFLRWPRAEVSMVLGLAPAHGTGGRVPREMGTQLAKKRVKLDFWAHWSIRST